MFRLGHATDVGKRKKQNEDFYYADKEAGIVILCDGMGGHADGDIASKIAVNSIIRSYNLDESFEKGIEKANSDIKEAVKSGIGGEGMGTTVVCLKLSENGEYNISWVGDSRAYKVNENSIEQLTEDHTFVNYMLKEGLINEQEAEDHPYKSVLLQAVGGDKDKIDISNLIGSIEKNEIIMLCSDGLTNEIEDKDILSLVLESDNLQAVAEKLVKTAVQNGGHDNISVVLLRM